MRKKKQRDQRKKQRSWYQSDFTSRLKSLARKPVRGYQQGRHGNLREGFALRKGKVYLLSREERGDKRVYSGVDEDGIHKTIKITTNSTSILYREEG